MKGCAGAAPAPAWFSFSSARSVAKRAWEVAHRCGGPFLGQQAPRRLLKTGFPAPTAASWAGPAGCSAAGNPTCCQCCAPAISPRTTSCLIHSHIHVPQQLLLIKSTGPMLRTCNLAVHHVVLDPLPDLLVVRGRPAQQDGSRQGSARCGEVGGLQQPAVACTPPGTHSAPKKPSVWPGKRRAAGSPLAGTNTLKKHRR